MEKVSKAALWGGSAGGFMLSFMEHLNTYAAAYSVIIGLLGLLVTSFYYLGLYLLKRAESRARMAPTEENSDATD